MDMKTLENLKSLSLLYVEDDAATREELAMMLAPWVRELHVASDGQEGLDLFKAKRPDIVLTDIQMPRISGLAMSGEIRRIVPDQSIVVLSAYNDVEYLFRTIELGIDKYITKPVNVERLLDKLAQIADVIVALRERQRNQVLLEQYKNLVDQSAIVCKLNGAGQITYVNDKLCEISGFASDELIGRDIAAIRHESEKNQHFKTILDQLESGRKWTGIIRNRKRNGDLYVVESSLMPIINEQGEVAEIVSMDVDITEIYENYENLVDALNRSRLSLEEQRHFLNEYKRALELGACICVLDRDFHIISVNKQFENLLGYSVEELQGKPASGIMPELSAGRCLGDVEKADKETFTSRILRFRNHQDQYLQFSVGCVGVHNLAGDIESIIMICQDITESLTLNREIVETQRELLYMMGDVVENRSQETAQHVKRVAQVSKFLALKAGLNPETADMIETAAPMHDVGKVGIRDAVLHKEGKLSPDEYEEMKHHARIGHSILGKVERPLIALAAIIAHEHHERWDGKGYPYGLKGEEINIAGRIVAIADVLDALSNARIYKPAWDEERVIDYFREQRGQQFDPRLVDLLLAHWDTIKTLRNSIAGA
ncbi:MAG: PAS domain S-box protein [Parasulfuritortus sp.]|nr:PAS domain S-box protein [Parasulfuritortus sp.]